MHQQITQTRCHATYLCCNLSGLLLQVMVCVALCLRLLLFDVDAVGAAPVSSQSSNTEADGFTEDNSTETSEVESISTYSSTQTSSGMLTSNSVSSLSTFSYTR